MCMRPSIQLCDMKSSLTNPTSPKQHKSSYNTMSTFETTAKLPSHNITHNGHKRRAKTPSFSSILLDAIYRSIDDTYTDTDSSFSNHTHRPKTTTSTADINHIDSKNVSNYDCVQTSKQRTKTRSDSHLETIELRHAILIDSWVEKQLPPQQQTYNHHGSYHNIDDKTICQKQVASRSSNIASSSSSYSSRFTQSKSFTDSAPRSLNNHLRADHGSKRETSPRIFNKTKLKALKIYNDLKKSNTHQNHIPISPGARISAFLNSIFRNSASAPTRKSTTTSSACSSVSSLSRSCLTKTTTSSEDKAKRSVKFYPVNVTVDDKDSTLYNHIVSSNVVFDEQQQQQQQQQRKWKRDEEIDKLIMMNKRNRSSKDYKEVLKTETNLDDEMDVVYDDDKDDDESCASSDLFELENFRSIGVSRFSQELPVYGTTSLKNLAS